MHKQPTLFASPREKYEADFQNIFNKLNQRQKQAASAIEGPVLVNAGPGTGKTQILATRIGKILLDTDAAPHNILCLTFTDAASIAMRNRLVEIIGPAAHQVHINTFHGFCNQLIQENLSLFGGYRQLEPATELDLVDVFRELIDNLPDDNVLKRFKSDRYYESKRMQKLFELMKKENISTGEFLEIIDREISQKKDSEEYIAKRKSTRKGKTYEKGDFRDDYFNEYVSKYDELKAAIHQYENYQKIMLEHERYDYHDMILWVLDAFRKDAFLLMQYQERYQYFLVDEYQDTNGAQNDILDQLVSYWEKPNVFIVGDDDQAIFKFQGANLSNLLDFKRKFDPLTVILEQNYRSNASILQASSSLIERNSERLVKQEPGLSKNLEAAGDYAHDDTRVVIAEFQKLSEEYAFVARQILDIYKNNPGELKDTAVIYRKHRQIEELIEILEKKSIPYNVRRRIDILALPFIKNIINLLKYLVEEYEQFNSSSVRLFELLHYSYFNIDSLDIARLSHQLSQMEKEQRVGLREFISNTEQLQGLKLSRPNAILDASRSLEKFISELPEITVQGLFENIINETGMLEWIMKKPDKAWYLQVLGSFFDFIKNETAKNGKLDLKELLSMLDKMKENDIQIPVNKFISTENGVHFVTAHSAKGLEYKNVFMLGCTKNIWDKGGSNFQQYKYPQGVNSASEINEEDERRLFYVAMTRAKTKLHISYAIQNEEGKDLGASRFVDELKECSSVSFEKPIVEEQLLVEFYYEIFLKQDKKIKLIEDDLIDEWLKDYKLNVTHLNKYIKCPISFYFESVLKVPSARNAYTGFGTAMHDALHKFLNHFKTTQSRELEKLLDFFRESMLKYRSHFTDTEYRDLLTHGMKTLQQVYEDRIHKWLEVPEFALEEELSHAEAAGVPIKGFIDKVEIYPDHVHVVDYKTGKAEKARSKIKPPNEKNPDGGDYWRQLVFYKILLDSDKKHNWKMKSAEIDFLEPNRRTGEFTRDIIEVSSEDINKVTEQISWCYDQLLRHNFDSGCGEEDCRWCNFIEDNKLGIKSV